MTVTFHHREFLNSKPATARTGPSRRNLATMRSLAMSALSPVLEHKRTQLGNHGIDANDPKRRKAMSARMSVIAG